MYIVILITVAKKGEAKKIAAKLLKEKLAACVNIMDKVESFFWWQGKIDHAAESLMVIKSTKAKFAKIVKTVLSAHSYTVPEIIALPIIAGHKPYLDWINESLR
jgi:periplasmic divalent cation tolerance protein